MREIGSFMYHQLSPVVLLVCLILAIRLWFRDRSLLAGTLMAVISFHLIPLIWYRAANIIAVRFGNTDLVNLGSEILFTFNQPVLWLILGTSLLRGLQKR